MSGRPEGKGMLQGGWAVVTGYYPVTGHLQLHDDIWERSILELVYILPAVRSACLRGRGLCTAKRAFGSYLSACASGLKVAQTSRREQRTAGGNTSDARSNDLTVCTAVAAQIKLSGPLEIASRPRPLWAVQQQQQRAYGEPNRGLPAC